MIAAAIEKIKGMVNAVTDLEMIDHNGRKYSRVEWKRLPLPNESSPAVIQFSTLIGLKEFASELAQDLTTTENLFFHVESPTEVALLGQLQEENFNKRFVYAKANCEFAPFDFSEIGRNACQNWFGVEEFVIALQSLFVEGFVQERIIDLLGNLANERVIENKDNKFTQTLQIRTGISSRSEVPVENPVVLSPYRTFSEIDQPAGSYILRYREGNHGIECALFDADGGQWQLEAMKSIKEYLEKESEIKAIA